MTIKLQESDRQFRKLVKQLDGHQQRIADALGIYRTSVAARLYSQKHAVWWIKLKLKIETRRQRERNRQNYARRKERLQAAEKAELTMLRTDSSVGLARELIDQL